MIIRYLKQLTKNSFPKIKVIWREINKPFVILIITLTVGYLFIPQWLQNNQLTTTQKLKEQELKYNYHIDLLNQSWKRLYFAKNYYLNWKEEPDFEARKIILWDEYQNSVKEWNIDLVSNYYKIEKYNGRDISIYFEKNIHDNFRALHDELLNIRRGDKPDEAKINSSIDALNYHMYVFAEKIKAVAPY